MYHFCLLPFPPYGPLGIGYRCCLSLVPVPMLTFHFFHFTSKYKLAEKDEIEKGKGELD